MPTKAGWSAMLLIAALCGTSQLIYGQTDPNAGILPFSTHLFGQYDTFDPSSGNIMLTIPIVNKTGKMPFVFNLIGNFRAWRGAGGSWFVPNVATNALNGSASGGFGAGTLNYSTTSYDCNNSNTQNQTTASNFTVSDATGAQHGADFSVDYGACGFVASGTGATSDGSGYTIVATANGTNTPNFTVYDRSGNQVTAPLGSTSGRVTDPDGVQMSWSLQYNANGTATKTYTDTLGQTVLIATYATCRLVACGAPSLPDTYTYLDASGTQRTVQVNYTTFPQQTNFACPGVPERNFGNSYLPTSVVFPDGETFLLSYEPTPGFPGSVTGRLARLTLPTGGYVAYSYSGSGGNGMNCSPLWMSTITRTLNDGRGNTSQWTYVPALPSAQNLVVTETDPALNTTSYHFYAGAHTFQTEKTVADSHGNLLSTSITCYNGSNTSQSGCIAPTPNSIAVVVQTDVYTSLGSGTPSLVESIYDKFLGTGLTSGNVVTVKRWNVGTYPPSGSPVSTTTTTYANRNGVTCGSTMQYIIDHPCTSTTTNSSGITVAQNKFTYNLGGHPTQTQNWVGGPTFLTSSATYNTNGTIATSTDANGQVTSYAYNGTGGCINLLPTSTTAVVNGATLTTSQTWNCFGGAVTSTTDANGKITQFGYLDQNGVPDPLWRLRSTTDPLGNATLYTYSPTAILPTGETAMVFNSGASTVDKLTTYDGLGRPILQQTRKAPGSSNFDTVMIAYDLLGRISATSLPCVSAASAACSSPVYTTTSYDALSRPLQVTDGGTGYTQYSYTPSGSVLDTLVTVGPNPSGENLKKRQLESDSLGRLTSVCEITGSSGSGSCSQAVAATGYRTVYTYDSLDRLTGVTQNAQGSPTQTRSFAYDGLSRMTSETNPESGTKTYIYVGPAGFTDNCYPGNVGETGDLHQVTDANGNYTCYIYDGLHRLTDVGNSNQSATNPCKRFRYDNSTGYPGSTKPTGLVNTLGRLVEAATDNCGVLPSDPIITDEWLNYNARGEQTDFYQFTPHSGGYYHTAANYFANGVLQSLSGIGQQSQYNYGVDGEGRLNTSAQGTTTFVTGTTYNAASQPTRVDLRFGDSDNYAYDPNSGRMSNFTFTVGATPKSMVGGLTWNANGTLSKLAVTDGFNSAGNQTCKYGDPTASVPGYDDLARLISANCGTPWSQTFSYDPFGNLTKSGSITWNPGYNQSTNRYTLAGTTYDAAGNLLNDTFHLYTWNVYGKLATVDSTTTLTNDANDRVVEKNASGTIREIEYSPMGKACVMNGATQVQCYVPLPGGEILSPGPDTFWHVDWLGSVRLGSSASTRAITLDRAFAPFGEMYNTVTGGTANPQFAGLTQDTITGEYDTDAREYHPSQGRWISPDPLEMGVGNPSDPQSWDLYAYVMNNPLAATDPTGLQCVEYEGIVGDDGQEPPCDHMTPPTGIPDAQVNANIDAVQVQSSSSLAALRQAAQSFSNGLQSATDAAWQFLTTPRNPTCVGAYTATGSGIGLTAGGSLGLAGGPFAEVTVPGGAGTGFLIGGGVGWLGGMISCRTGGVGSGGGGGDGGGGGGGGGKNGWTNKIARDKAKQLGYAEARGAPFNSRNQLTFRSGRHWITPDVDGHTGYQTWKVFDSGGNRLGTYNTDLTVRLGK